MARKPHHANELFIFLLIVILSAPSLLSSEATSTTFLSDSNEENHGSSYKNVRSMRQYDKKEDPYSQPDVIERKFSREEDLMKDTDLGASVIDCTRNSTSIPTWNNETSQNGIININSNMTFIGCTFSPSSSINNQTMRNNLTNSTNITQLIINLPTVVDSNGTITFLSSLINISFVNCNFESTSNQPLQTTSTISLSSSSLVSPFFVSTSAPVVIGTLVYNPSSTSPPSSSSSGLVIVSFINCTFDHNSSPSSSNSSSNSTTPILGPFGGAVFVGANLSSSIVSFDNCQFTNNNADYGGAVALIGEDHSTSVQVSFSSSSFVRNRAAFSGAVHASSILQITISSSLFSGNLADGHEGAGALQIFDSSSILLQNTYFESNQAHGIGSVGAVWLENSLPSSSSSFSSSSTPEVQIVNCTFMLNDAPFFGLSGALVANYISDLLITNSSFSENGSNNEGQPTCQNGVLTVLNGNLVIKGSTFETNIGRRK
jgi:hypothetical protein